MMISTSILVQCRQIKCFAFFHLVQHANVNRLVYGNQRIKIVKLKLGVAYYLKFVKYPYLKNKLRLIVSLTCSKKVATYI